MEMKSFLRANLDRVLGVEPGNYFLDRRLLQMHVWDITPSEQRGRAREMWGEFVAAGHQAGEYQVETGDGRVISVMYEAVANFRPGLHLSLLQPLARGRSAGRPLDECPYERPFPADFDRCPTYREAFSDELTLHGHRGERVRTCAHFQLGRLASGRFYGRCELGDAIARTRLTHAASS